MKWFLYFALVVVLSLTTVLSSFARPVLAQNSLTSIETKIVELVSGSNAYSYDLKLENISLSHYAFRSTGSVGANEAADLIANQFESFGLEVKKEVFQFTSWDLLSKPTLVIDYDGNSSTTDDQTAIESFQSLHYSLPTDVFTDLVILPLPPAKNRDELGRVSIGTLWDGINTTDKVVLVGYEIRFDYNWEKTFNDKLAAQPPAAVIHTWWYDWMAYVPDVFASAGGRPTTQLGTHYFWDSSVAAGFVNYEDGLFIRSKESIVNVSAKVVIDSVINVGPHYNVIGKLTGYGDPSKCIIVSGHYDTVMCSGFCDNGAGTSGVIELARVFTDAVRLGLYYPKYTILFVAFDAEEIGLVGSINYVAQHKGEMKNIIAVINLDCIGSDVLEVTETEPDRGIDLDQIVLDASRDLGVNASLTEPGASDELPFLRPADGDNILMFWWNTSLGISDAEAVGSSCTLISYPYSYAHIPPGWIHTSYDNSTSTKTLNWVEADDLGDHIKVAAVTIMRVVPPFEYPIAKFIHEPELLKVNDRILFNASVSYSSNNITSYEWNFGDGKTTTTTEPIISHIYIYPGRYTITLKVTDSKALWNTTSKIIMVYYITDLNKDGTVNIIDLYIVAKAFGTKVGDPRWNEIADINNDGKVSIEDLFLMAKDHGKTV